MRRDQGRIVSPAKRKTPTIMIEIDRKDAEVWASFVMKSETRHKRMSEACRKALTKEANDG